MFFTFGQNNSGGYWIGPTTVIIEADSPEEANRLAPYVSPVYFDGVKSGQDCKCCGNRWSRVWETDKGDPVPSIWGEPTESSDTVLIIRKQPQPEKILKFGLLELTLW